MNYLWIALDTIKMIVKLLSFYILYDSIVFVHHNENQPLEI